MQMAFPAESITSHVWQQIVSPNEPGSMNVDASTDAQKISTIHDLIPG
jgi:hypothetical protein